MPSRILEKIKERVKLQNEQPPKPQTKEQQMDFGIKKFRNAIRTKKEATQGEKINNII